MARSLIEKIAQGLRIIPNLDRKDTVSTGTPLRKFPSADDWHDHVELDAQAWPEQIEKRYSLVPTTCFNCESACGLLAYIDKDTGEVQKFLAAFFAERFPAIIRATQQRHVIGARFFAAEACAAGARGRGAERDDSVERG